MSQQGDSWHIRNWTIRELQMELSFQRETGRVSLFGSGYCGHISNGGGFCAECVENEIQRRGAPH